MEDKPVTSYDEIRSTIQQKAKLKKAQRRKRIFMSVFKVIVGVVLAVLLFAYHQSDFSKITKVYVSGNYYVTEQEVIDDLEIQLPTHFYSFLGSQLAKNIDEASLVESVKIEKNWLDQSMNIFVTEKKVLGYVIDNTLDVINLVAADGSQRTLLSDELSNLNQLIRLTGFRADNLISLIEGLSRSDDVLLSNISEILHNPKSYDDNYLRVLMSEGIEIHSSVYSLEKLSATTYKEILNRLQPKQNCIVYDVFWKSAYAKPCQSTEEPVEIEIEQPPTNP